MNSNPFDTQLCQNIERSLCLSKILLEDFNITIGNLMMYLREKDESMYSSELSYMKTVVAPSVDGFKTYLAHMETTMSSE